MNIIGQGGKIMLATLPFAFAAVVIHFYAPQLAALPAGIGFIQPFGYVLLVPGIVFWLTAVIQLLTGFPKGKLITTGAYGLCSNPIYSSFILFVLPAISLLTLTWVYAAVSLSMLLWVILFIGKEEKQLAAVFGKEYDDYKSRVDRVIPFVRPFL